MKIEILQCRMQSSSYFIMQERDPLIYQYLTVNLNRDYVIFHFTVWTLFTWQPLIFPINVSSDKWIPSPAQIYICSSKSSGFMV